GDPGRHVDRSLARARRRANSGGNRPEDRMMGAVGFARGQVGMSVAWQSLFLASGASLVGVPLGIAAGRRTWATFADRVGVVPQARIPLMAVLIGALGALVLANHVGVLPA